MSPAINKQADLSFYLLGNIREFLNLFRGESREGRINSEV
jgi:hypothetical protein